MLPGRNFKLSRDKRFVEKLTDVVGLYMNPPDKALVLCVDEKSQIQALNRTQPGLPMKKGRCGTMTHDYKRNGTTTLFAALNVLEGTVIGECMARHRHQEFLKFLRRLDREFPPELDLHLIVDNYGTHKQPTVQNWLARHRRFHLHFIPTSSSWLNLVERWFRDLTEKQIRRGTSFGDAIPGGGNRRPHSQAFVAVSASAAGHSLGRTVWLRWRFGTTVIGFLRIADQHQRSGECHFGDGGAHREHRAGAEVRTNYDAVSKRSRNPCLSERSEESAPPVRGNAKESRAANRRLPAKADLRTSHRP